MNIPTLPAASPDPGPAVAAEVATVPAGVRAAEVVALRQGRRTAGRDWLAEETPVALVYNGISHAVMMATPDDLEDFALGFSLTEGLLRDASELRGVDVQPGCDGIELHLEVSSACEWRLKERRRSLAGRTGCGLCGTDSLSQLRQPWAPVAPLWLQPAAVTAALQALRDQQPRQQLSGATHAAALCRADGAIQLVREDVGRHNALDKLIGACQRQGLAMPGGFVAITSRASFEMVQKAVYAGVGALAAVSAPTALAVDLAREAQLLLLGFVRAEGMVAYTFPERIGAAASG